VTEIETWIADPYAIHARRILRLDALDPLEQATDAADYGSVVHDGLHRFFARHGTGWPADARAELCTAMDEALAREDLRPALREWWRPRLHRIADWVAETQGGRERPVAIATELRGIWALEDIPGGFTLTGRADRIERRADGRIAILDYKTGSPPTAANVAALLAPQLPLEAAMARAGAFGEGFRAPAAELTYWQLSGGFEAGKVHKTFKGDPAETESAGAEAEAKLRTRIAAFDDPQTPYLARPYPAHAPRFGNYAQLARVAEWDLAGEAEDE
jgi:ATP-dependent helicase/nuclease subunit B